MEETWLVLGASLPIARRRRPPCGRASAAAAPRAVRRLSPTGARRITVDVAAPGHYLNVNSVEDLNLANFLARSLEFEHRR